MKEEASNSAHAKDELRREIQLKDQALANLQTVVEQMQAEIVCFHCYCFWRLSLIFCFLPS